jgi:hypothetical protein
VTTTTTIAAMLRAVKDCPESMADDSLRVILADALTETDPSEGGDADWAEFIRAGVEFERGCETCEYGDYLARRKKPTRLCPWCVRETKRLDALRAEHEARWRQGPKCPGCRGAGGVACERPTDPVWFRRFGDDSKPCPDCAGTGWTGPLGEKVLPDGHMMPRAWRIPAEFRRGFIASISTPLADVFDGDTVTEWAVRVAQWPCVALEEWGLTDKEPGQGDLPRVFWQRQSVNHSLWAEHYVARRSYSVPDVVFDELPGVEDMVSRIKAFDTPAAARHALARAVAATVNEAAHD